ncbi:sigma-54 dependent transcriptional regulator [Burkholderia sp. S-53]|uniref:sigma-54 dependent transcriptional regulator n=1 Tax=Burkholderia sp. S-53 TaxID=2906514 RepID=UPI0039997245
MHDGYSISDCVAPDQTPPGAAPGEAVVRPLVLLSRMPDASIVEYLRERHWRVHVARSTREAMRSMTPNQPQAGIVDFDGFEPHELLALEDVLQQQQVGWVALAGDVRLNDTKVRQWIRQYCADYTKPSVSRETIEYLVCRAYRMAALGDLDLTMDIPDVASDAMLGTCDAMQQLFRRIRKVAATDATVFIAGESGTGKELTARAVHAQSARRNAPLVSINCGALPPTLLQAELFGYERGAFTGANQRKIGRVEAANGGTLFLDEIGDTPLESQASLLRFLQEGKIERLGAHQSIPLDVRILSATHADLNTMMRAGRFREDLYHRLCVLKLEVPPLRVRGKDIDILAHHILRRFQSDGAGRIRGFAASAVEAMHTYAWPGNVRELINRIRRAIVMSNGRLLSAADLDLRAFAAHPAITLAEAREQAERQAIEAALLRHPDRMNAVAAELGVSRSTLYRLMIARDVGA